MPDTATLSAVFDAVVQPLTESKAFAAIKCTETGVRCDALHVEEECYYAAHAETDGTVWVGWYTPNRWLSESVEADLVHTGDKIDELLEEELVDQGLSINMKLEHFRDTEKVFVFRGKVALPAEADEAAAMVANILLAFQACFIELGDMGPDEDDE